MSTVHSLTQNQSEQHPVQAINFDRDEELIRELSPDTAAERFQMCQEDPKQAMLRKRFRDIQPFQGKIGARKLYNHEGMTKRTIAEKGNNESPKMKAKAHSVQSQRQGKQMPMRLAKNANISYVY